MRRHDRAACRGAGVAQQRLEVVACSQRVNRKIRTGTIVVEQAGNTHRHSLGLRAGRAYYTIAIKVSIRRGQDAYHTPVRPLAAKLLLDQHEEPRQYWGVSRIAR